ncbi:unnamed protein product [Protopolystoma xenopodis]|uniref:Uncharacterized protein n=1 Tax=Protopolystoma xenopodis TaxID=117903 RepID=A0A3S5AGD4_9PLAT|nr:unnamed protein product [Protopolystoma xenopodis]
MVLVSTRPAQSLHSWGQSKESHSSAPSLKYTHKRRQPQIADRLYAEG